MPESAQRTSSGFTGKNIERATAPPSKRRAALRNARVQAISAETRFASAYTQFGRLPTAAEPFLPDILSDRLESLAVELPLVAGQFSGRLAPRVRSMNCYYSNLIKGHDTHPHDIDRALAADYSSS
jgi:hypothetical protein